MTYAWARPTTEIICGWAMKDIAPPATLEAQRDRDVLLVAILPIMDRLLAEERERCARVAHDAIKDAAVSGDVSPGDASAIAIDAIRALTQETGK